MCDVEMAMIPVGYATELEIMYRIIKEFCYFCQGYTDYFGVLHLSRLRKIAFSRPIDACQVPGYLRIYFSEKITSGTAILIETITSA